LSKTRATTAVAVVLTVWCAGFLAPGLHVALLYLAPALLLALALLAGRYPGERALEQIVSRAPRLPRLRCAPCRLRWPQIQLAVRGGLLIASGLAGRAPPCAVRA
jgi:hypothetical protein